LGVVPVAASPAGGGAGAFAERRKLRRTHFQAALGAGFNILPARIMFAALLTTLLFSLSAISGRRLSGLLRGTHANLLRLLLGAVFLGGWAHLFGFGVGGAAFPVLFLSGGVGFGVADLALFQTYRRLGARRSMVMAQCVAAPIAALIEWLWLGHAPTLAQAGFAAIILAGVAVALLPHAETAEPANHLMAGILFGLVSAAGQALGAVLSRKAYAVAAAHGESFTSLGDGVNAAYQRILGGIFVTAVFLLYLKLAHHPDESQPNQWRKAWPWLAANSIVGPSLGVTCYQWALISTPTSVVLPIVATTPLVVIPLAHFFDGDRITVRAVVGGVIAVGGVIGLTLAK